MKKENGKGKRMERIVISDREELLTFAFAMLLAFHKPEWGAAKIAKLAPEFAKANGSNRAVRGRLAVIARAGVG